MESAGVPAMLRLLPATALIVALAIGNAPAALGQAAQVAADQIFGYALMTDRERDQYRERLRNLDGEARERFEAQHRDAMRERARQRGVDLDDADGPGRGTGRGQGEPQGPGEGPGQRVGPYGETPGQQDRDRDRGSAPGSQAAPPQKDKQKEFQPGSQPGGKPGGGQGKGGQGGKGGKGG